MTELEEVQQRAESDAKTHGYFLNPDPEFLADLLEGLKKNEERHGYPACPCRLASGKFEFDRDIICPCDYRDIDVLEFGYCYCALYVRKDVFEDKTPIMSIPERRPIEKQSRDHGINMAVTEKPLEILGISNKVISSSKLKFWYCKQCGYVVFREEPPYICPICKAKREFFAEIKISLNINA